MAWFHHKGKDHSTMSGLQGMASKITTDMVQQQAIADASMQHQIASAKSNNMRVEALIEDKQMTEDDIDKLLDAEDDEFSSKYRESRIENLKHEALKSNNKIVRGEYIDIKEDEFLDMTTKNNMVIVHF